MLSQYFFIAEIARPQGINGELKLNTFTEDKENICNLKTLYTKNDTGYIPFCIEYARIQGNDIVILPEGVTSRDQAEKYRGIQLYISREDSSPLKEGQYYISDLIGLKAQDSKGVLIGELKDVLNHGATDIYVFRTDKGNMMMPALKKVIKEINLEHGTIILDENTLDEIVVYE